MKTLIYVRYIYDSIIIIYHGGRQIANGRVFASRRRNENAPDIGDIRGGKGQGELFALPHEFQDFLRLAPERVAQHGFRLGGLALGEELRRLVAGVVEFL